MKTKQNKKTKILKLHVMKNSRKPAVSKLVASFDNELLNIIMSDLRIIRTAKRSFLRAIKNEQLSVA